MSNSKIRSSTQLFIDADFDLGTKKATSSTAPVNPNDLTNKTYVDGVLAAADAMIYKGVIDCSANPNYPTGNAGWTYKVSVGGKIGGASGTAVLAGDIFVCTTDGTVTGDQATVGIYWDVIHVNAGSGMVSSSASSPLDNQIVRLDSTTGALIQNSLATISDTGSINVPAGQTYNVNGSPLVTGTNSGDQTISLSSDVSGSGTGAITTTIQPKAVTLAKMADMATASLIYRKTAATGVPEVNTLATLKTDLGLTGTNSGNETTSTIGTLVNGATAATPNDTDLVATVDTSVLKKITWTAVKAFLKTYFDTLYQPVVTFITREAVGGTKDGSNATFTLAHAPTAGSEMLFMNGILLNPGAGNDYTISGLTITMLTTAIPISTDIFLATYRY